ncbi:MAG TPA: hypothetical protein VM492_05530, partial [Sumerlaeia bacterium]|nr:hypothetical protein [Sumerlaeia bacterium]
MSWKKVRKTWKRAAKRSRRGLVYLLTILARRAIVCLPLRWARGVGGCVGVAAFALVRKERRRTLENLKLAYAGGMSKGERLRLGREVFRNAGRSAAEAAFLSTGRGGNILTGARVEGLEHIRGVLESGRGVLAVTAHFGNWELVLALSSLRFPCKVGAVARDLSNPGLNRLVTDLRKRCGAEIFTRGESARDYVRFLRKGNALGILGDIDTSKGEGLFVDFFGRPAWTQSGVARLARIGGVRIVPAFIFRDRDDPALQVCRIEPPLEEPPEGLSDEEWIRATTQAFTKAIENAVRERPDLWMWMQQRWRRQPGDVRTCRLRRKRGGWRGPEKTPKDGGDRPENVMGKQEGLFRLVCRLSGKPSVLGVSLPALVAFASLALAGCASSSSTDAPAKPMEKARNSLQLENMEARIYSDGRLETVIQATRGALDMDVKEVDLSSVVLSYDQGERTLRVTGDDGTLYLADRPEAKVYKDDLVLDGHVRGEDSEGMSFSCPRARYSSRQEKI